MGGGSLVRRIFDRAGYAVNVSIWNAYEISGPTTQTMIELAKIAQVLGLAFVVVCYVLWLRRGRQRFVEAAALMLLVVLMMILTNKTFSPQYVMWLGGPAAAGIAMLPHSALADDTPEQWSRCDEEAVRRLRTITRVLLAATFLTTMVYPVGYDPIVQNRFGLTLITLVLVARNGLLVWMFVLLAAWVLSFVRSPKAAS